MGRRSSEWAGDAVVIEEFFVHSVTVKTLAGSGPYGDVYETHADVPCFIEDKRRVVRDKQGAEVISETTIYADIGTVSWFKPDSMAVFWGRESTVITLARFESGDLDLPDHVAVSLS